MINNKKVLGLIPARGGSKRIKRKNVRNFAGSPLISWTIKAGLASKFIDCVMLSSEDEEIAQVAKDYGCDVFFQRPTELSTDEAKSIDVVLHALDNVGENYELLVLLQPTSPLRTANDIDACIEKCVESGVSSCVSVTALDKPTSFYGTVSGAGIFSRGETVSKTTDVTCYLNGAVYVASTALIRSAALLYSSDTLAYFMPAERSIDIDEEYEFIVAEALMRHQLAPADPPAQNQPQDSVNP